MAELVPANLGEGDGSQSCWLWLQRLSVVWRVWRTPITKSLQKHQVWVVKGKTEGKGGRHIKDVKSQYEWLPSAGMVWKTVLGQIQNIFYDWEVKQLKMLLPWKLLMSGGIAQDQFHSIPTSIDIKMAGGTARNKAVL